MSVALQYMWVNSNWEQVTTKYDPWLHGFWFLTHSKMHHSVAPQTIRRSSIHVAFAQSSSERSSMHSLAGQTLTRGSPACETTHVDCVGGAACLTSNNCLCLPRAIKMASGGKSSPKEPVKLSDFKSIGVIVGVLHKQSNWFLLITSSSSLIDSLTMLTWSSAASCRQLSPSVGHQYAQFSRS